MKASELRDLPDETLLDNLDSAKEELFNLRFQSATGQLDEAGRLKTVRHDVARILTVLREREIERASGAEAEPAGVAEEEDDE
jgi:large subunit ribosomal protein L29